MNLLYTTLVVVPALDAAARAVTLAAVGAQEPQAPDHEGASQEPDAEALRPQQLVRVPNNLVFQRPLRTRSTHAPDSKAPFFSRPKE